MLILHSLLSLSLVLVLSAHAFLLPGRPNRLPPSFELDKRDEHGQWVATPGLPAEGSDTTMGICPAFEVKCVLDRDWRHPVGYLGKRPFCRVGLRCNQCEEERNTRECNRMFREECKGRCEAYGPVPF